MSRECFPATAYAISHRIIPLRLDSWMGYRPLTFPCSPRHRILAHHPQPPPIPDKTLRAAMRKASVLGIGPKPRWATPLASRSMATAAREQTPHDGQPQPWATEALTLTQPQGVNVRTHQPIPLSPVSLCLPKIPIRESCSAEGSAPALPHRLSFRLRLRLYEHLQCRARYNRAAGNHLSAPWPQSSVT